jgi:ABC-type phosphate transport system substrate-binding protein
MRCRISKFPLALAVGAGLLGSLAFSSTSLAAPPAAGVNCQVDGKIDGRGATFQTRAQQLAFIPGYTTDVCGPVPDAAAGNNMVLYNYAGAANGSGQGQTATTCRSDDFAGSDVPYDLATYTTMKTKPGNGSCALAVAPPYNPTSTTPPLAADAAGPPLDLMSFPVAGSSVAIGVHLVSSASCPTPPSSFTFSTATMSKLIGGDLAFWDDPALVADTPALAGCHTAITRVVRLDKSGTTQTFKNYLKNADGSRAGAVCEPGTSWTTEALDANNTAWPTTGGTCSALIRGAANGGPALITALQGQDGGVGYADLADWTGSGIPLASLRNANDTGFFGPGAVGTGANCSFNGAAAPGSTNSDAVGISGGWAIDASPNVQDQTFQHNATGYPICGFTWDFVWARLNNGAVTNPLSAMIPDQRRTLYSYMQYILSPLGQNRLNAQGFAPIPNAILIKLRAGLTQNF